ncbi:Uncharacterized protein SCF082_LOCUS34116, partial [Durusdinium trenchii]
MNRQRHRPIAGQMSLIGDPPVQYCGGCGRMLKDHRSRQRGFGPHCWLIQQGKLVPRFRCRSCKKRIEADAEFCPRCGEASLMNVQLITADKEQAREKLRAYRHDRHKDAEEEYRACAEAYEAWTTKSAPRLAIAAADRKQVELVWHGTSQIATFDARRSGRASDRLRISIDMRIIRGKWGRAYEEYRACAEAYEALAEGTPLIDIEQAIRSGGLDDEVRPRLAIAAADRKQVELVWHGTSPIATFDARRSGRASDRLRISIDMRIIRGKWGRAYARVPMVPADVRPEKGQLRDWHILWEVDEWADRPFLAEPPRDPLLLKHIRGSLYAVLAQWDLT